MQRSADRILTTHAGSLPRPADLIELYRNDASDDALLPRLRTAVGEVVQQQPAVRMRVRAHASFAARRERLEFG